MSQSAPGDHLCLMSGDLAERRGVLATFVGEGLQRDERVLYLFADPHSAAAVFDFLERPAWQKYLATGQLNVASAGDNYLVGGAFRPQQMIKTLRREAEAALEAGWKGLRVTSEMSWASHESPGAEPLLEYENGLPEMLSGLPVTLICQYDRRQFDTSAVETVEQAHTGRVGLDPVYSDEAMRIFPTFDPPGLRVEGAVDSRTGAAFAEALGTLGERVDEHGDTHLDVGGLQFIDLDGLRHVAWAAGQLPEGRRLVLHRLAAHHRDLISLLRWDEIPGLSFNGGRS